MQLIRKELISIWLDNLVKKKEKVLTKCLKIPKR